MPRSEIHYLRNNALACGMVSSGSATLRLEAVTCPACLRTQAGMPESALLRAVREAASAYGWLCHHHYDSRRSEPGWPDIALCKPGRPLLLAELKTPTGKLRPEQDRWYRTLMQVTGVEMHLWRPADLPMITQLLARKAG